MHTVAVGRTQKQDGERGIDEQDIVHRMVFFLAALTPVCSAGSRCRHGQRGGRWCSGWDSGHERCLRFEWGDHGDDVSL